MHDFYNRGVWDGPNKVYDLTLERVLKTRELLVVVDGNTTKEQIEALDAKVGLKHNRSCRYGNNLDVVYQCPRERADAVCKVLDEAEEVLQYSLD